MKKKKSLIILVIVLSILFIIALVYVVGVRQSLITPFAATGTPTLGLSPANGTISIGETLNVDINVDTSGNNTDGVGAISTFNSNDFDVVDADANSQGVQLIKGTFYPNVISNKVENGKIIYEATSDLSSGTPVKGSGILATIKLKAKQSSSSAQVKFNFTPGSTDMNNSTIVESTTAINILSSVTNGNYVLGSGNTTSTGDNSSQNNPSSTDTNQSATNSTTTDNQTTTTTEVSKLPTNLKPAPTLTKKETSSLIKNQSMKPWVLWFLYAIIPAFLAGIAIFLYIKRRKVKRDEVI